MSAAVPSRLVASARSPAAEMLLTASGSAGSSSSACVRSAASWKRTTPSAPPEISELDHASAHSASFWAGS